MYLNGRSISWFQHDIQWDGGCPTETGFLLRGIFSTYNQRLVGPPTAKEMHSEPDVNRAINQLVERLALRTIHLAADHLANYVADVAYLESIDGTQCQISKQKTSDGATITVTIRNPKHEEKTP